MSDVTEDAVAWRVLVRDTRTTDKTWRPYAIYPTEKGAINTVRIIEGEPLEVMVQPLYTSQQHAIPAWQPIESRPMLDESEWPENEERIDQIGQNGGDGAHYAAVKL